MAFKLSLNPTFKTTARINCPTDDGLVEQTVEVRFRLLPKDDLQLPMPEFLARAVMNVDGIIDDAGAPLSWTSETADQCLELPFFAAGLFKAYDYAVVGLKQGN